MKRKAKAQTVCPHCQSKGRIYCSEWSSDTNCGNYLASPEPPSEIIIERFHGEWTILESGRHCTTFGRIFHDYEDPMIVTKYLKAKAAGPIKVWWNL